MTYNPILKDGLLLEQLRILSDNISNVLVVDNGSENIVELRAELSRIPARIKLIELKENLGIAYALNRGVDECLEKTDCNFIITLDQDTTFARDALPDTFMEIERVNQKHHVGVFGLNYSTVRFSKEFMRNKTGHFKFVNSVITSGTIIRREVASRVRYDDILFMYFVDTDYCYRIRSNGYKIGILGKARMNHHEGERVSIGGKEFFFVQPLRLYFMSRNSMIMLKRYGHCSGIAYVLLVLLMNMFAGIGPFNTLRSALKGFKDGFGMMLRPRTEPKVAVKRDNV